MKFRAIILNHSAENYAADKNFVDKDVVAVPVHMELGSRNVTTADTLLISGAIASILLM